ncbi:hypothetical protein ABZZ74_49550 [Streptomyces sp. NPDC006476]|uniref:hypothetical protein n=1 Tax=Streptomyces sp. NPDC006476 TaxID=3157175 RepID=UPI0033A0E2F6
MGGTSACKGWSVQDVVTHLGHFFQTIADPGLVLPDNPSGKAEQLNDLAVAERRHCHWSQEEALAYYEKQASAALPVLAALQEPPAADTPLPAPSWACIP